MVWSSANVVSIWDMFGEELIVLVGLVVGGSVVCCNRPQRSTARQGGRCDGVLSFFYNCSESGPEVKCVLASLKTRRYPLLIDPKNSPHNLRRGNHVLQHSKHHVPTRGRCQPRCPGAQSRCPERWLPSPTKPTKQWVPYPDAPDATFHPTTTGVQQKNIMGLLPPRQFFCFRQPAGPRQFQKQKPKAPYVPRRSGTNQTMGGKELFQSSLVFWVDSGHSYLLPRDVRR